MLQPTPVRGKREPTPNPSRKREGDEEWRIGAFGKVSRPIRTGNGATS